MAKTLGMLFVVGLVAWFNSIMFTWQSRARNQNDVRFFQKANFCAQLAWFLNQTLIGTSIFNALIHGSLLELVATGVVYIAATCHASTQAMKYLIKNGR